jgi:hypothetical protein
MASIGVCPSSLEQFDRTLYPVRYCHVGLSKAIQVETPTISHPIFKKDVQDCGDLIDKLLADVRAPMSMSVPIACELIFGTIGSSDPSKTEITCKGHDFGQFWSRRSP